MPIRVAIADDHQLLRAGLVALLSRQNDVVLVGEASTGLEIIELAKKALPDIVLMDIAMPELNGVDATRRLREAVPTARVIAVSGQTDPRSTVEMLRAGANGFVLKDCAFEELVTAITTVAAGKSYLSPSVSDSVIRELKSDGNGPDGGNRFTAALAVLTSREREVLQRTAEGLSTKQIALKLGVSAKTVETHRRNIMDKTKIDNVAGLTRLAIREGLTNA